MGHLLNYLTTNYKCQPDEIEKDHCTVHATKKIAKNELKGVVVRGMRKLFPSFLHHQSLYLGGKLNAFKRMLDMFYIL